MIRPLPAARQNRPMFASRAPWPPHGPDVLIAAAESVVKKHPSYPAAKGGDITAAWVLVSGILDDVPRDALDALMRGAQIVASVHAFEGPSINRIPDAMGLWLERRYGVVMETSLVQINRVGHTRSSGWHRLAHQALFDGSVASGARYVLVDDFVGQGGTLANLRGYIMKKGGAVDGFLSLTGQSRSAKIGLQPETLVELRNKHAILEAWWRNQFGFGFDSLTESEAIYLLRVDADTIRNRLAAAG